VSKNFGSTNENENVLWVPSQERKTASSIFKFSKNIAHLHGFAPDDYDGLHRFSIEQPEQFWSALWDYLGIIGEKGATAFEPAPHMRDAKFFPDAKLNYAQNLLRDPSDKIAIIATRDDGTRRQITRLELKNNVSRIVKALRSQGIEAGDRIAGIVTNDIEAIEFYLACAAIGAIWASCSPDFGPNGASDRLNQIEAKLLVAVPDYRYGDKNIDITKTINAVANSKSIEQVVILGEVMDKKLYCKPAIGLEQWLAPHEASQIDYFAGKFDTPLVILFSSGTTGAPKCIIHRAGGLLLQHLKEHALHCDIRADDKLFYFSTCGWMMWNWQISALALGTTLLTFDGNPFYPAPQRLPDLIEDEQITVFGTSAKYIDALKKFGVEPKTSHDLASLKTILSTGSPLLPASFDYIYDSFKADVHLASISGGTDICACFVGGVPVLPVRRGQIQVAMLGIDVVALDENGHPVIGKAGEMVCRSPFPSMPLGFWGDPDGERYFNAYFSQIEGNWCQGDFLEHCQGEQNHGVGYIIHGRSDTVLNPGGVRIGTAEIYRQVEAIDQVLEAVAVGQEFEGDQRIVLFVRLVDGVELSDELQKTIRTKIRLGATPRHVPAIIAQALDIPRTRSGKISEIAVRDIIHGRKVKNTSALANAQCLQFFENWASGS